MVMLFRRDGTGGSVGLVLPGFGRWDAVLTSGARTAPGLLLAEDPEAEPAPSTSGLSSITQNSRERAPLLERTWMLLHPSGAAEAVPCAPARASTRTPGSSSLTPTRIPLAPGLTALPATSHLLPLLFNQIPTSFSGFQTRATPRPSQPAGNPNNSHHRWGVGACAAAAAAAPPKRSANIICS